MMLGRFERTSDPCREVARKDGRVRTLPLASLCVYPEGLGDAVACQPNVIQYHTVAAPEKRARCRSSSSMTSLDGSENVMRDDLRFHDSGHAHSSASARRIAQA